MSKSDPLRAIEPQDLFRLRFLHEARLSTDGETVVYGVSHVDAEKEEEYITLWLLSLKTGVSRQLTSGLARDFNASWSPDGKRLAFISTRDGTPQIFLIPPDGGEAQPLTTMKQGVGGGPVWSPDGRHIAFAAGPAGSVRDLGEPYTVNRSIYRFDGLGYLDEVVQDIYVVDAQGGEPQRLTTDGWHDTSPLWSPDGREILFTSLFQPDSLEVSASLRVVDLDGQVRSIVKDVGFAPTANWTPDGRRIVFTGTPGARPDGYKDDLWIVDADGSSAESRTTGLIVGVGGAMWGDIPVPWLHQDNPVMVNPEGTEAYVHVQERGAKSVHRVALEGPESWSPVVKGDRSCALMDIDGEHLLFAASTMHSPPDLFIADLDGANERQLTHLNDELTSQWSLPSVDHLLFASTDGEQIEGWIMKPPMGQAPYPTILYVHGGPWTAVGHLFVFDIQMLAGAGYAVLFINQRGSSGYGDDFSTRISGDWGNLDYQDLMAAVDFAVDKGISDPERLGVCGLSVGGYLTCWIIVHTDRFKAAVPENPITNWLSSYGVADISAGFCPYTLGGTPDQVPEVYRRCSPITYAHRCSTPTLLVQGEDDYRCPPEQSEQFYTALKANGCVTEMLRLPHSSHYASWLGPPAARRAQNEALLGWMNRYLLGQEPAW